MLNTWKPNSFCIHHQMITVVILMILLTCQAQFCNFLHAHHEINGLHMFYFVSLFMSKDGDAHCVALRAYHMHNVIQITLLVEHQPLSFWLQYDNYRSKIITAEQTLFKLKWKEAPLTKENKYNMPNQNIVAPEIINRCSMIMSEAILLVLNMLLVFYRVF